MVSSFPPPPEGQARLLVLASGAGSNLRALLEACADPDYGARVVAVGTDRPDVAALEHAAAADVPTFTVRLRDHQDREAWDRELADRIAAYQPDLLVSAGFMKIAGPAVLARYGGRFINTHPALLPSFPGAHGVRDALAYGVRITGCTVHLVDEGVDSGPIIAQRAVEVGEDDTEDALHTRIKNAERSLLTEVVGRLAREGHRVVGRTVTSYTQPRRPARPHPQGKENPV